jgi:hypothetical protein
LRKRTLLLGITLFFGVLSTTAVREMCVDCRAQGRPTEGGGCVPAEGGGVLLAAGRQCEIEMGGVRVPLPAWAQAMIK